MDSRLRGNDDRGGVWRGLFIRKGRLKTLKSGFQTTFCLGF